MSNTENEGSNLAVVVINGGVSRIIGAVKSWWLSMMRAAAPAFSRANDRYTPTLDSWVGT